MKVVFYSDLKDEGSDVYVYPGSSVSIAFPFILTVLHHLSQALFRKM